MYICPFCKKEFDLEESMSKHYLKCWKEINPSHQTKSAPRSENIDIREINDSILNFFDSFQER